MTDNMKELVKCFANFTRLFDEKSHPEVVKAIEDMRKHMFAVNDEYYLMSSKLKKPT
jgi:hypothetical protein